MTNQLQLTYNYINITIHRSSWVIVKNRFKLSMKLQTSEEKQWQQFLTYLYHDFEASNWLKGSTNLTTFYANIKLKHCHINTKLNHKACLLYTWLHMHHHLTL